MANIYGKINFNTKHLKTGDPLSPFNGKLRVYNMRFCPYAQRTILALIAKEIDCDVVNVNLVEKPEWLSAKSAFGKVPAIEVADGVTIYESLITVEYLDEVYTQRPLLPKDPVKRAFEKIVVAVADSIASFYLKMLKWPDTITNDNVVAYHQALNFIQDQLESRGTTFLGGEEPGYADYMIWPWFERYETFNYDDRVRIDEQKYKLLMQYIEDMSKDPVVKEYALSSDTMRKFYKEYTSGVFNVELFE